MDKQKLQEILQQIADCLITILDWTIFFIPTIISKIVYYKRKKEIAVGQVRPPRRPGGVLVGRQPRQRDRNQGAVFAPGRAAPTVLTVVLGAAAWVAFAFWLHALWIGVAPMARG